MTNLKFTSRYKMTKAEALRIQAEQVAHYKQFNPAIENIVAVNTRAHELEDGIEYPVEKINPLIPRGADIENLCFRNTEKAID